MTAFSTSLGDTAYMHEKDDFESMESNLFRQLDTDKAKTNPWDNVPDGVIITNLGKISDLASNTKAVPFVVKEMDIDSKGDDNNVEMSSQGRLHARPQHFQACQTNLCRGAKRYWLVTKI